MMQRHYFTVRQGQDEIECWMDINTSTMTITDYGAIIDENGKVRSCQPYWITEELLQEQLGKADINKSDKILHTREYYNG